MENNVILKVKKTYRGVVFSNYYGSKWLFPGVPVQIALTAAIASTLSCYMNAEKLELPEFELKLTLVINP